MTTAHARCFRWCGSSVNTWIRYGSQLKERVNIQTKKSDIGNKSELSIKSCSVNEASSSSPSDTESVCEQDPSLSHDERWCLLWRWCALHHRRAAELQTARTPSPAASAPETRLLSWAQPGQIPQTPRSLSLFQVTSRNTCVAAVSQQTPSAALPNNTPSIVPPSVLKGQCTQKWKFCHHLLPLK